MLALLEFTRTFSQPHVHSGIGIRKMRPKLFECRARLRLRLLLCDTPEALIAYCIGSHDEVQRRCRSGEFG